MPIIPLELHTEAVLLQRPHKTVAALKTPLTPP